MLKSNNPHLAGGEKQIRTNHLPISVGTTGPQPGTSRVQWAPLDLNRGPPEPGPQPPDRMPNNMPEYMPSRMPDRMPEYMSDKLSEYIEYMSKYTSWNVMVGITRSKVMFVLVFF